MRLFVGRREDNFEVILMWIYIELSLVQILFVVAKTEERTFWIEVENGSVWTSIENGLVDPKAEVKTLLKGQISKAVECRKGIRLIFLNRKKTTFTCCVDIFYGDIDFYFETTTEILKRVIFSF